MYICVYMGVYIYIRAYTFSVCLCVPWLYACIHYMILYMYIIYSVCIHMERESVCIYICVCTHINTYMYTLYGISFNNHSIFREYMYVYAHSLCWGRLGQAWLILAVPSQGCRLPFRMAQDQASSDGPKEDCGSCNSLASQWSPSFDSPGFVFNDHWRKLHFGYLPDCVPTKPWHSSPITKLFFWHRMKRRTLWLQELQKQWLLCRRWEGLPQTAWTAFLLPL